MATRQTGGSPLTAAFSALVCILVLAVFATSIKQTEIRERRYRLHNLTANQSYQVGAGDYQLVVVRGAEESFMPAWQQVD